MVGRILCAVVLTGISGVVIFGGGAVHAEASDQCGLSGQPPCLTVSDVTPRLVTSAGQTVTLTGTALDQVTAVHLLPDGSELSFGSVDFSTLRVTLPDDLSAGSYTLEVVGPGGTARTGAISFLGATADQAQRPSYAPATAPASAAAQPPAASTPAPQSAGPARQTSWRFTLATVAVVVALAGVYLGLRKFNARRQRAEELEAALARMRAFQKDRTHRRGRLV